MVQMSTQKKNVSESKTQEAGSSWDTSCSNDPNDSSWQLSAERDFGDTPNMNPALWNSMSINGGPKEVDYVTRELPLSIQSVFRNRSIGSHKEKSNDSIRKQAVKIASYETASPAARGQTSHKSSIYKRLVDKHLPISAKKQTYEITKDACQETVESLRRGSEDIHDELNKLLADSKQDESSMRRTPHKAESPEKGETPLTVLSRKSSSLTNTEKEVNPPSFHTMAARKLQSKTLEIGSEEWHPLPEGRSTQAFPWDGTTSMVKEKITNPENEMLYQSYDPNYLFKLDM